jgi:hypothetical protein
VIHHDFIKATKYIVFGKSQYVLNRQNSIYPMARNEVLIRWLKVHAKRGKISGRLLSLQHLS